MDRNELRSLILEAQDLPTEIVDVPEWDTKVYVRGLTAEDMDVYIRDTTNEGQGFSWKNARALLVVRTVVDEAGERIFSDNDAGAVGAKSAQAVGKLFDVASKLCGFSREDQQGLADTFGNAQTGNSSSA
jgi:hypothetical protein